ncbi:MAG: hypothetical protein ACM3O8_14955 [Methylococcaceae bacterium]|nr:hypothetical protein [Prolixibacteraceae bacterium]
MIRAVKIFLLFIVLSSCRNGIDTKKYSGNYDILISYNFYKTDSTNRRDYLDNKYLRDGNLYLVFESNFHQDTIFVKVNGKQKVAEIISTDPSTGVARQIKFENINNIKNVGIRINNGKEALLEIDTMNFFLIEFSDKLLKINVPKSVPFYD